MRGSFGVLGVAFLLVTAGCAALGADPVNRTPFGVPDTATETPTQTTASLGSTTTAENQSVQGPQPRKPAGRQGDAAQIAPGVTRWQVLSPRKLVDAHETQLANQSFRVEYVREVHTGAGYRQIEAMEAVVSADREKFVVQWLRTHPGSRATGTHRLAFYSNGSTTFRMFVVQGNRSFTVRSDIKRVEQVPGVDDPTFSTLIYDAFRSTRAVTIDDIAGTESPPQFVVNASGSDSSVFAPDNGSVSDLTMRSRFNYDGAVLELDLSYVGVGIDPRYKVDTHLEISEIGNTTVEAPLWADVARRTLNLSGAADTQETDTTPTQVGNMTEQRRPNKTGEAVRTPGPIVVNGSDPGQRNQNTLIQAGS